jgi:hypothetical protein
MRASCRTHHSACTQTSGRAPAPYAAPRFIKPRIMTRVPSFDSRCTHRASRVAHRSSRTSRSQLQRKLEGSRCAHHAERITHPDGFIKSTHHDESPIV